MSDDAFLQQAEGLVRKYVSALDRRDYEAWLKLFADDAHYSVLRNEEYLEGNNVLIVGEDMKRLSARIASGATRDLRRSVHCLGWCEADSRARKSTASFALWLDGRPSTSGRYELEFADADGAFKLRRCTVVLDAIDIVDTVYLPI